VFVHAQRRVAGPQRVVIMGKRRAEQRHDAVAHHLVDGALEAVHGIHHVREHRVEEPARVLGIAINFLFRAISSIWRTHNR
jgi:hypothetical protein